MPWSEAKYRDGRLEADGPGRTLIPTPGEIVALGRNQGVIPGLTKYPETRIPGEVAHLAPGPWRVPSGLPFLKYGQTVIIWDITEY